MTLVYARAILSMEKISSHSLRLYVDPTDNFIQKWVLIYHPEYMTKLCIQASSLGHALINCAFTVLFKKRGRSVVCNLEVFFVCLFLYRFIKRFKGLFLATFLESRYQIYTVSWWCVLLCWKGRKLRVCVNKKYAYPEDLTAPRSDKKKKKLLFRQHFSLYSLRNYLLTEVDHNMLLSVWISSRPKTAIRTENNS